MKNFKYLATFAAFLMVGGAFAGSYTAPDVSVKDVTPKYHPTKPTMYEDSYHIAGVNFSNDRAIASESEAEREPSSVPVVEEQHAPKPWLHREYDDKDKF